VSRLDNCFWLGDALAKHHSFHHSFFCLAMMKEKPL